MEKYDAIIIGSGIGGLTTASLLAQHKNKKVLLLEQHSKIGGFTHIFKRKGTYLYSSGVHYVGEMGKGEMPRAIMDYITEGKVEWQKMPKVYDVLEFPNFTFEMREGKENFKNDLIERFPAERESIEQYFNDLKLVLNHMKKRNVLSTLPSFMNSIASLFGHNGKKLSEITTAEYLDSITQNKELKAVLAAQYGDYGLPPAKSSFLIHALIQNHYFNGGYAPVGTSKQIADSIVPVIEEKGGAALKKHEVTEIIVKEGKAVGVKVIEKKPTEKIEKEFYADVIISNAGADLTYNKFLKNEPLDKYRNELNKVNGSISNVSLYVGFKEDPKTLGFTGANHWIYNDTDLDSVHNKRNEIANGKVNAAYLSFPSMKNDKAPAHTAEIISFCDYKLFEKWIGQPWKQRDEDYYEFKERISEALLNFIEEKHPGFKDIVDITELGTPLTTQHFLGYNNGNIYGVPATPERYKLEWLKSETPVKNLYLTGTDAMTHGIVGAMMGGVITAALIMGMPLSLGRIFASAKKFSNSL